MCKLYRSYNKILNVIYDIYYSILFIYIYILYIYIFCPEGLELQFLQFQFPPGSFQRSDAVPCDPTIRLHLLWRLGGWARRTTIRPLRKKLHILRFNRHPIPLHLTWVRHLVCHLTMQLCLEQNIPKPMVP